MHMVENMAYVGKVPWHGLGVPVSNGISVDKMLEKSGADFEVVKIDNHITWNGNNLFTGKQSLVRADNGFILDTVPKKWKPVQNKVAFEFFRKFVKEGHMELHTAGVLDNGRTIWVLAKIKKSFRVGRSRKGAEDLIDSYLLFTLPHQYGKSTTVCATPIRVVCWNTLQLALNGRKDMIIRVNHRRDFDPTEVQKTLYLNDIQLREYEEKANFLASKRFNKEDLAEFFKTVFPSTVKKVANDDEDTPIVLGLDSDEEALTPSANRMLELVDEQPGADLNAGTWWSAFNAVTYATDHVLGQSADTRLKMAFYGRGRKRKQDALEAALEFAKAA